MSIGQQLLAEFEQESVSTRRVLERVPQEKFDWRPHPTSMSLGQLALHVAGTPAGVMRLVEEDRMEVPTFQQPAASSHDEVMSAFDQSVTAMRSTLGSRDDTWMMSTWSMRHGDRVAMQVPRAAVIRMVGMNHLYHHRGQLVMCLRMLGVPVPSVYGASADENPFV